jgi:hypothetical protein
VGGFLYICIMVEEWKDIEGHEDIYKISNTGKVWSIHTNSVREIKPSKSGYITVGLWKNNKQKVHRVHRLVAHHFIPNVNNLPMVDHIDGNRDNNNINNLRWVTQEENQQNQYRGGRYSGGEHIKYFEDEIKNEVWVDATKKIPELKDKDYLMVSNLGRIRYKKKNNRWNTFSIQTVCPRVNNSRYPSTTIRVNNNKFSLTYHKMVALCFLRPLDKGEVINHIDSNISNCRLSNLEILTQSENIKKAIKQDDRGINNGRSKHSKDDIHNVLYEYYFGLKSKGNISNIFKMDINTVTRIVSGETYKNIYNDFMSKYSNFPDRPTNSELQSQSRKGLSHKKITCPHCGKVGGNTNMVRYHFNNCKNK